MKNLPGRCKSRMMAMKAWGCLPKRNSPLCFFSSFTFLGRLFFLCICLLVFLCCSSCSLAFCSVCLFFFVFLSVRSLWFSPLVCLYYLRSLGLPSPLVSSVRPCWMLPLCCCSPSQFVLCACASPVLFQYLWSPTPPPPHVHFEIHRVGDEKMMNSVRWKR